MKRNMSSLIAYMTLLLLLASCSKDVNIKRLIHRELTFMQLPQKVQKALKDPYGYKIRIEKIDDDGYKTKTMENLVVLDCVNKYSYSILNYPLGPKSWIKGMLLTDISTNKKYQIDREDNPHPYIIYSGKLYIPKEYNIFTGDTWYTSKYTEYILK